MSKKTTKDDVRASWGPGYVIYIETPNHLIGELKTLIEATGMPENQERSVKSLIEQCVWNRIQDSGISISGETHTELRSAYWEERRKAEQALNKQIN